MIVNILFLVLIAINLAAFSYIAYGGNYSDAHHRAIECVQILYSPFGLTTILAAIGYFIS